MYLITLFTIRVWAKVLNTLQVDSDYITDPVNVAVSDSFGELTSGNQLHIIPANQHGGGHISRGGGGETKEDDLLCSWSSTLEFPH